MDRTIVLNNNCNVSVTLIDRSVFNEGLNKAGLIMPSPKTPNTLKTRPIDNWDQGAKMIFNYTSDQLSTAAL